MFLAAKVAGTHQLFERGPKVGQMRGSQRRRECDGVPCGGGGADDESCDGEDRTVGGSASSASRSRPLSSSAATQPTTANAAPAATFARPRASRGARAQSDLSYQSVCHQYVGDHSTSLDRGLACMRMTELVARAHIVCQYDGWRPK